MTPAPTLFAAWDFESSFDFGFKADWRVGEREDRGGTLVVILAGIPTRAPGSVEPVSDAYSQTGNWKRALLCERGANSHRAMRGLGWTGFGRDFGRLIDKVFLRVQPNEYHRSDDQNVKETADHSSNHRCG